MLIRYLRSEDGNQLKKLFTEMLDEFKFYPRETIEKIKRNYPRNFFSSNLNQKNRIGVAAVENHKLVGFCFGGSAGGVFWIDWIGVKNEFKNKKVGSKLLLSLISKARSKGNHKITCSVLIENQHSQKLFLAAGFSKYATVHNHWFNKDYNLYQKSI